MAKKKSSEDKGTKQKSAQEQTTKVTEQKKQPPSGGKKKETPDKPVEEPAKIAGKTKKKQPQKPTSAAENTFAPVPTGFLTVRLPKTLRSSLEQKMLEEEVSLDELVTYLLMRGLAAK